MTISKTYGLTWYRHINDYINASCSNDLSKCTSYDDKALVLSNTTPGCVSNGTCVVAPKNCNSVISIIYDGSASRKNGFNLKWNAIFKSDFDGNLDLIGPTVDNSWIDVAFFDPGPGYLYSNGAESPGTYFPLSDFYLHKVIKTNNGAVRMYIGNINTAFSSVELRHCSPSNWVIGFFRLLFFVESSPLAIIPLDYSKDYLTYQELRKTFAYSYNGVDQPGWNAQDIINILKEIFPDRVWMVYDDSDLTLYGYGITLEHLPDWLIAKLNPCSFKVLKEPCDLSLIEKFISELESRNHVRSQG